VCFFSFFISFFISMSSSFVNPKLDNKIVHFVVMHCV
jgi:hypothetical protein